MKKDIETRADIELLINTFYSKVKKDTAIGYIFTDAIKVNWEQHLPVMYRFWENVLFYTGGYDGNPVEIHKRLNSITPLQAAHFRQWLLLFNQAADELFEGEKTMLAKQRAESIATVIQIKIAAV
jgi:hemoglobin